MADSDSDVDFMSEVLDCDAAELRTIDNEEVQKEAERLNANVTEKKPQFMCNTCNARFTFATNLNRHLKNKTCSKKSFICQNCGKTYDKQAFLTKHTERGKCIRPKISGANALQPTSSLTTCTRCGTQFSKKSSLTRHLQKNRCSSLKKDHVYNCGPCGKTFSSAGTLKLHSKTHETAISNNKAHVKPHRTATSTVTSGSNEDTISSGGQRSDCQRNRDVNDGGDGGGGGGGGGDDDDDGDDGDGDDQDDGDDDDNGDNGDEHVQSRRSLFMDTLIRYTLKAQQAEQQDIMYFFSNRRRQLRNNILRELRRFRQLKWYVVLKVDMVRLNSDGEQVDEGKPVFRSFTRQVLWSNDSVIPGSVIDAQIDEAFFKMLNSLDAFRADGSGWIIRKVLHMQQTIAKYSPLGGSCYHYEIEETLLRKRCLLNVTGPPELDGYCFKYAVLAGLFTDENVIGQIPWSDLHRYRDVLKFLTELTVLEDTCR